MVLNQQVIPWVALQRAGKVMHQAVEHLDAGREADALKLLILSRDALKGYGPTGEAQEAVRSLEQIIQRIERGEWGERARKNSSYRSASYRKMSSRDYWSGSESAPSFKKPEPSPDDTQPPPSAS